MNKIQKSEFLSMFIMVMLSTFLGMGVFSIVKKAGIDAWVSVIIAGILGIFLIVLINYIFNYEKSLPIHEKLNRLFGSKVGIVLKIIFLINLWIMGICVIFNLSNFIATQLLQETSPILIGFLFSILVILINIKGLKSIARTCVILLAINFLLFFVYIFNLIPEISLDNFMPVLEHGLKNPTLAAFYILLLNIMPFFLLLIIPKDNIIKNKNINKGITFCYILIIMIMFLVIFVTLGNLGIHLTKVYQYPEYIVLKRVNFFDFLDRIENIINVQWLFGLFMNFSIIVYNFSNMISYENQSKILPSIITLGILGTSILIFKNSVIFNNFIYHYSLYGQIVILIILIAMVLKIKLTKKKS